MPGRRHHQRAGNRRRASRSAIPPGVSLSIAVRISCTVLMIEDYKTNDCEARYRTRSEEGRGMEIRDERSCSNCQPSPRLRLGRRVTRSTSNLGRRVRKNLHHLLNSIPITGRGWHAEELLDLAQIADRLHLPTIQTQDESVLDRNDLQQPLIIRGQSERQRRQGGKSFG